jgi:hypothetical protein
VRPEFVRFLGAGDATENRLMGRVYNEYALGSRIQYQVRVGEAVFIVEKLRQQAFTGSLDDEVGDRLERRRQHPGERLMPLLAKPGPRNAVPLILLLLIGFAAPLLAVIGFSLVPARTFSLWQMPTLENYAGVFSGTNYISFVYSLIFAAVTVIVLAVICYPVALGLVRVFGKWSMFMSLLFTIPLFVSENVRLYGWVLFFIKNGVLLGTLKTLRHRAGELAVHPEHHPLRHGLCVSALHAVPDDARHQHGAEGNPRRRLRSRRHPLAGVQGGRSSALHARHHYRISPVVRPGGRRHRRSQGLGRPADHPGHP